MIKQWLIAVLVVDRGLGIAEAQTKKGANGGQMAESQGHPSSSCRRSGDRLLSQRRRRHAVADERHARPRQQCRTVARRRRSRFNPQRPTC